jgi:hypothetical protein
MTNAYLSVGAVLGVLLVYQVYVSWLTFRTPVFTRRQKVLQLGLVWALPALGAAVVHWFVSEGISDPPPRDMNHIRQDIPAPGATKVTW